SPMGAAIETHRSMVKAWECDSFGHFTVAYYFDRIADASVTARERLSVPEGWTSTEYVARFTSELRAGEAFHIESGVLAVESAALLLGHRVINSATGKPCTTVEERLAAMPTGAVLSTQEREALTAHTVAWESAKEDPGFADGTTEGWITSARDRVRPLELDGTGHLALAGYVHRSSIGCIQLLIAMGLSPDYLRASRRGFSTFEVKLRLEAPRPVVGDALLVTSGLLQVGNASVRMIHRVSDATDGRGLAPVRQSRGHF